MKISFTGHRNIDVTHTILQLDGLLADYSSCDVTFLSGMAEGFDLLAAERVLAARASGKSFRLGCIVPYMGQINTLHGVDRERYQRVLSLADEVLTMEEIYSHGVYYRRNTYLVSEADLLIAYFDGIYKGGTADTIRRARRVGREVINLYPTSQLSLF